MPSVVAVAEREDVGWVERKRNPYLPRSSFCEGTRQAFPAALAGRGLSASRQSPLPNPPAGSEQRRARLFVDGT